MRRALAVGVFLGLVYGCAIDAPTKPGQDWAFQIVWQQQYQQPEDTAPTVYWIEGQALNCARGRGWVPPPQDTKAPCVAGLYYDASRLAYVAWPPTASEISDTAFAHELCHAYMWRTFGDGDVDHVGPCFVETSGVPPYVTTANEALAWLGL